MRGEMALLGAARFVNSIQGWKSVEEIDKRADYILACHDEAVGDSATYPYDGMTLRRRRRHIPGYSFYFAECALKAS